MPFENKKEFHQIVVTSKVTDTGYVERTVGEFGVLHDILRLAAWGAWMCGNRNEKPFSKGLVRLLELVDGHVHPGRLAKHILTTTFKDRLLKRGELQGY